MNRLTTACIDVVARASALAIGAFLTVSLACAAIAPNRDAAIWLLDTRWLPLWARALLMLAIIPPFLDFAIGTTQSTARRSATTAAAIILAAIAATNCLQFWSLLGAAGIQTDMPLPASAIFALLGELIALVARPVARASSPCLCNGCLSPAPNRRAADGRAPRAFVLAVSACFAALFPFLQMLTFGMTDYRRPADAILVFGARAYADGTPSDALDDRMLAACDLYKAGVARTLILSGGPGDAGIHETDVMRRVAIDQGVPPDRLLLDPSGLNTRDSIRNTALLCSANGMTRIVAISHFYHLPRIKVEANRANLQVFTAPASQRGRILRALPYYMTREAAAWWWSLAKPD